MKNIVAIISMSIAGFASAVPNFIGEYKGSTDAKSGYFKENPTVHMQISKLDPLTYQIKILPFIARRANEYALFTIKDEGKSRLEFENQGEYKMSGFIDFDSATAKITAEMGAQSFNIEMKRFERVSPTIGLKAPENAVVLVGKNGMDAWVDASNKTPEWNVLGDVIEVTPHNPPKGEKKQNRTIYSKNKFKDFTMHAEFKLPAEYDKTGQGRGNSGLFVGAFEVQILDSYHSGAFWNECGALYQFQPPQVDASLPAEVWQTYDIEYTAPRFEGGKLVKYPVITVYFNGVKIHSNVEVSQATSHIQTKAESHVYTDEPVSISLQDHDHKVQFRNMWVVEK